MEQINIVSRKLDWKPGPQNTSINTDNLTLNTKLLVQSTLKSRKECDRDNALFIGGLDRVTTTRDLEEYFSRYGNVENCFIKSKYKSGRKRWFGFVVFSASEVVKTVLDKDTHIIGGRRIYPRPVIPRSVSKKVFVGNLHPAVKEEAVKAHFEIFGQLESVTYLLGRVSGQRRGFCFVEFKEVEACRTCLNQTSHFIETRRVAVKTAWATACGYSRNECNSNNLGKFRRKDKSNELQFLKYNDNNGPCNQVQLGFLRSNEDISCFYLGDRFSDDYNQRGKRICFSYPAKATTRCRIQSRVGESRSTAARHVEQRLVDKSVTCLNKKCQMSTTREQIEYHNRRRPSRSESNVARLSSLQRSTEAIKFTTRDITQDTLCCDVLGKYLEEKIRNYKQYIENLTNRILHLKQENQSLQEELELIELGTQKTKRNLSNEIPIVDVTRENGNHAQADGNGKIILDSFNKEETTLSALERTEDTSEVREGEDILKVDDYKAALFSCEIGSQAKHETEIKRYATWAEKPSTEIEDTFLARSDRETENERSSNWAEELRTEIKDTFWARSDREKEITTHKAHIEITSPTACRDRDLKENDKTDVCDCHIKRSTDLSWKLSTFHGMMQHHSETVNEQQHIAVTTKQTSLEEQSKKARK